MKKKKSKSEVDKNKINNRHIELFNITLDSIEILTKKFFEELENYEESNLELSKNLIATLDFLISAIGKIQKGQRLALNLDKDIPLNDKEPQINVIEGIDIKKI